MAEKMFEGFDHTKYKDEVTQRWGKAAYATSDAWWKAKSSAEQEHWLQQVKNLNEDWIAAATDPSISADSPIAQELAARHIAWLKSVSGTPAAEPLGDLRGYVHGLADMYVSDPRFAANYGGVTGAKFVRDALLAHLP